MLEPSCWCTPLTVDRRHPGKYGAYFGNQQFTARNLTINGAQTGIAASWNWGWTFQGLTINNCKVRQDGLSVHAVR